MALDHLAVYLSNSCNLSCSYCYVAVNQGPAAKLSLEQVRAAVDEFYARVPAPDRKITFLGGEPLLDWPLFEGAARHARERGGRDAVLQTFTNGALLTPEKVAALRELDVHCTVSLDGKKADNDRHRSFVSGNGRSVHDEVLRRLAPLDKGPLGVSLVFTSETVDRLLSNLESFRAMGFGRVTFNPELYEEWPDDRIEALRHVLKGVARWYKLLLDAGQAPQIQILHAVLQNLESNARGVRWWHDCHNMVLGPDARYYSCDKALSFPIGQAAGLRTGGTGEGMDWGARRSQLAELADWIEERGGGEKEVFCPIGVVAHAREAGREPGEALAGFRRVADAFAEGLCELVALCREHPRFQELYVGARVV